KLNSSPSSAIGSFSRWRSPSFTAPPRSSDGLRIAGCGVRQRFVEVAVETHGNDTQQQAAARSRINRTIAQLHETVFDQVRQAVDLLPEVSDEIDAVPAFDLGDIDAPQAHELLNHVGAQEVVAIQVPAAPHGQAMVVDRGFPCRQIPRVLAEAVADVADRAHAEADEIAARVR